MEEEGKRRTGEEGKRARTRKKRKGGRGNSECNEFPIRQ